MLPAAGTITYRWLNPIRLSYTRAPAVHIAPFRNDNGDDNGDERLLSRRDYFPSILHRFARAYFNILKFRRDKYIFVFFTRWTIEFLNFAIYY